MAIQIGKYKRPGIFIEEFDNSIISTPVVEGITNLVIGVSKKGPVNTPIRVTTVGEFESTFGQLDRSLERKGSFFHRTVSKMLETSPIFAMNLLKTDDALDVIEYQSISAAAAKDNDIEREGPYRRFFDTTGFWKRDTEAFINLTKNSQGYSDRAFNLTNLSDKYISVFIFKSQLGGFDRTLLEYYGSVEKMPSYVNPQDFASDYLVDVVIIAGDWSNYQELSVDNRWSAYFSPSGLRKDQVSNFANDRNITTLAYYEGLSLIPYFRDLNGRNIFIETSINRDTDTTGLFCAFNSDLVEQDFYNGLLDLIGNTLVDAEETSINFLSYKETITEAVKMTNTPLDLPGNVTAILNSNIDYGVYSYTSQQNHAYNFDGDTVQSPFTDELFTNGIVEKTDRTSWFAEGSVYDVTLSGLTPSIVGSASRTVEYVVGSGGYCVIGDQLTRLTAGTTSFTIDGGEFPESLAQATYSVAFVIDSSGDLKSIYGGIQDQNPSVTQTDIVLGYLKLSTAGGLIISTDNVVPVTVDLAGFVDFTFGTQSGADYHISLVNPSSGDGKIKFEFRDTAASVATSAYKRFRRFKAFNRLTDLIDGPNKDKMALLLDLDPLYEKWGFENIEISDIVTSPTQNKSFILSTGLTEAKLADILAGYFVMYTEDNEFILGKKGVETEVTVADLDNYGIVAKYANFYQKFYDGLINTKDFFYSNRIWLGSFGAVSSNSVLLGKSVNVKFFPGTGDYAGYDYVIFESGVNNWDQEIGLEQFEMLQFPDSNLNKGSLTIVSDEVSPLFTPIQLATALGSPGGDYYAYRVNENVVFEELLDVRRIYDLKTKHYLKMYLDNSDNLYVDFLDELLEAPQLVATDGNNSFWVQSEKSNFRQTLEIEIPNNYIANPNRVLVKADRYTEVRVGDFLEAHYSETIEPGQFPRKLTRILSKKQFAGDPTLTEITCDARIATIYMGEALQTTRYSSIDQYATTYKVISLKGFRIRTASLPDGTELRQSGILDMVAKGTTLFKAITNKEAIDFRYLIDSFGLGLTERSKQQLVDICGTRLDAFGFINMPSARMFKNSSSPTFVNREGVLQTEFIAKGGDPESSPAFLYSFGDGVGTTCVGYFFPYLNINDNGRPLDHPAAPFVATTFMRKHISNAGNVTPWTIAAGVTNGRITGINSIEQDLTAEDIEYLNQAQINPIVFKRNRGNVIETENTAQTLYKSALSYIHVREVLIELERELSRMLLDFQWKFNTPDIRAEIKLRADVICETYVSRNGLFNYFNKMDDENNTSEIIDNQIGVLDTFVEPIKGMGVIVNNITILRTGAIAAGGFINP